jgi:proline iminopeptidase
MKDFYPAIEPNKKGFLKVSDLHEIYYEESGNPEGAPIVFLHGGPGGGTDADQRRFFDPHAYRIVLFDQRGCGQSKPHAELKENTTWDLVSDIEKIREYLKIEKWVVFGGSWGSTLALTYAVTHPARVKGLILRGIFLCRPEELQWFYQQGASWIFPDVWEKYWNYIPADERSNMMKAYYSRLTSDNSETRLTAAQIWSQWEAATSRLFVDAKSIEAYGEPEKALAFARIECHYFMNNAFFPSNNYLLENIEKIKGIPGVIIQGRYDVVCPAKSAWDLHRLWPEAEIKFIPDAGHAAAEPGTRAALIEATDQMRSL